MLHFSEKSGKLLQRWGLNNVLAFPSFLSSNSAYAEYPSKGHWLEFLGIVTITTYIISYLNDGSAPSLPTWLKPLVTPLAVGSSILA